jgi:hypothetical protein
LEIHQHPSKPTFPLGIAGTDGRQRPLTFAPIR